MVLNICRKTIQMNPQNIETSMSCQLYIALHKQYGTVGFLRKCEGESEKVLK